MRAAEPELVVGGGVIGMPGASAQIEYERRSAKDRAARSGLLVDLGTKAAFVGVIVGVFAETALHSNGPVIGGLFAIVYFLGRIGPKTSTVAWSIGSNGEARTAQYLDPLAELGYVVMHDLRISMSRANVDHLVIGPTGVFVIETKNIRGAVRLEGRDVRIGGRRTGLVDEVVREVAAVRDALGPLLEEFQVSVDALVCAHRADLPWFHRTVGGIRFVYPHHLRREITERQMVLTEQQIAELRARAERHLPPRRSCEDR